MPHDLVRIEETRLWFAKAKADLRGAAVDMEVEPPLVEDAMFHCQQAVEKALKGFLTWHDQPFRKTHNLVELGMQCSEIAPSLEPLLHSAARLSGYATIYRYPGTVIAATAEEAANAQSLAKEVVESILLLLPSEVCP